MKRIVIATSLLAGCTNNADIGIDDQPVSCMPNNAAAAEAHGTVKDLARGSSFSFGDTTVSLGFQPTRVLLSSFIGLDQAATMHLSFLCGQPTVDTYGVEPVTPQVIDCPLSVAGDVGVPMTTTGLSFADASGGTLIIDENANCLAGRFDVKFDHATNANGAPGTSGELAGWFSVPWQ